MASKGRTEGVVHAPLSLKDLMAGPPFPPYDSIDDRNVNWCVFHIRALRDWAGDPVPREEDDPNPPPTLVERVLTLEKERVSLWKHIKLLESQMTDISLGLQAFLRSEKE